MIGPWETHGSVGAAQMNERELTRRDVAAAGAIAAVLVAVFISQSLGLALIVTFVPGVVVAFVSRQ